MTFTQYNQQGTNTGLNISQTNSSAFMNNNSIFTNNNNQNNFGINSMNQQQQNIMGNNTFAFGMSNNLNNMNVNTNNTLFGYRPTQNNTGIMGNANLNQQNTGFFSSPNNNNATQGRNTNGIFSNNSTILGTNNQSFFGNNAPTPTFLNPNTNMNNNNLNNNFNNNMNNTINNVGYYNQNTMINPGGYFSNGILANIQKFIPTKPRNVKIQSNGKHLVKSITEINQNNGNCLKQLKSKYFINGQHLAIGTAITNNFSFFNNNNNQTNMSNNAMGNNFMSQNYQQIPNQNISPFTSISPNTTTNTNTQLSFMNQSFAPQHPPTQIPPQNPPIQNFQSVSSALFPSINTNQNIFNTNNNNNNNNSYGNGIFNQNNYQQQYTGFSNNTVSNNSNNPFTNPTSNTNNLALNSMAMQLTNNPSHQIFPSSSSLLSNQLIKNNPNLILQPNQNYNIVSNLLNSTSQNNNKYNNTPNYIYNVITQFLASNHNNNQTQINSINQSYNLLISLLNTAINTNMPLDYNTQIMLYNSFFSSQIFKNILTSIANKKNNNNNNNDNSNMSIRTSISEHYSNDCYEDNKQYGYDYKKAKKSTDLYRTPFIFKQDITDELKYRNVSRMDNKDNFEVKMIQKVKQKSNNQPMLKKTTLDHFQECYDKYKKRTLKEIIAKTQDLPINDIGYRLIPGIQKLSQMTQKQLKNLSNVQIQNNYGYIKFLQPINIYKKKLSECIQILQDQIQIYDNQWSEKRCQINLKNFSQYRDVGDLVKKKIVRKMNKWILKNGMKLKEFDQRTGDLTVDLCF